MRGKPYMSFVKFAGILGVFVVLSGCTRYRPQPLVPDKEWVRIESLRLETLVRPEAKTYSGSDAEVPSFDYSNGLSADESAALAVALNPEVNAFRMEHGVAKGQLIEAGLLPNPEIDTKWLTPPVGPTQFAGEVNAFFNLTEALVTRGPRKDRARTRMEQVAWDVADKEWRLANETRQAFSGLVYEDEAITLNEKQKAITNKTLSVLKARHARGAASELDVLVAETELANLERQAKQLEGARKLALQGLNRSIGLPPNHDTRLQKDEKPLAFTPPQGEVDQLAEELRSRRFDLVAAEKDYLVAERDLQIACRKQFPRVSLGPSYEGGDGERNGRWGLGLAFEIPFFNRNQGEIVVRTAEREQKRRSYEAKLQSARAEFHAAWTGMATLDAELKVFFAEVAPRLERSLELMGKAFDKGEVDVLQVLLLQEKALQTQREILERLREFHRARIAVEGSLGPKRSK